MPDKIRQKGVEIVRVKEKSMGQILNEMAKEEIYPKEDAMFMRFVKEAVEKIKEEKDTDRG